MDRNARLSRVLRTLAVPAYVVGGVVLLAVLIHVWDSLLGRVLLIAAIMVFGLWMWWHSWPGAIRISVRWREKPGLSRCARCFP